MRAIAGALRLTRERSCDMHNQASEGLRRAEWRRDPVTGRVHRVFLNPVRGSGFVFDHELGMTLPASAETSDGDLTMARLQRAERELERLKSKLGSLEYRLQAAESFSRELTDAA
jgi:hypothetical protein